MTRVLIVDFASSVHDYTNELYSNFINDKKFEIFFLTKKNVQKFQNFIKFNSNNFKIINYLNNIVLLITCQKKYKIKVIHWQFVQIFFISYLINLYFKKSGLKIIYTAHNSIPYHGQKSFKFFFQKIGFNLFLKSCDDIIVHNKISNSKIQKICNKTVLIPHGLLTFGKINEKNLPHLRFNSKSILFFGILSYYKGIDRFVLALEDLLIKRPDIKIIIAGKIGNINNKTINLLESLSRRYNNLLLDLNYIDKSKAHKLFINSKVIILPYRNIDDSGVLNAAINYIIPPIISDLQSFYAKGLNKNNSYLISDFSTNSWLTIFDDVFNEQIYKVKFNNLLKIKNNHPSWQEISYKTKLIYDAS